MYSTGEERRKDEVKKKTERGRRKRNVCVCGDGGFFSIELDCRARNVSRARQTRQKGRHKERYEEKSRDRQ